MKKKGLLKLAFTLIEMLVVIAIIGMLAVVAVMSFSSATRTAKLDIASDMLVSLFKQQQSLTKSGRGVGQDEQPRCYGLIIDSKAAPGNQVKSLNVPYYAIKGNEADLCDIADSASLANAINYDAMSDVKIANMTVGTTSKDKLMVFFKPPFAKTLFYDNSGNPVVIKGKLIMTVAPVNGDGQQYVTFDPVSGISSKQFQQSASLTVNSTNGS